MLGELSPTMKREIDGWPQFAEDEHWLDPPDEYLMWLPRPRVSVPTDTLHWNWHADNFELGASLIECSGTFVLDLGASRCWTTKELSLRGARCVAIDILTRDKIGLGTERGSSRPSRSEAPATLWEGSPDHRGPDDCGLFISPDEQHAG